MDIIEDSTNYNGFIIKDFIIKDFIIKDFIIQDSMKQVKHE